MQKLPSKDWPVWRGERGSQGFSSLSQINRANVAKLRLAWSISLGQGSNAIAPLAHDGVIFVQGGGAAPNAE
jgi:glucose dehydrogenase